MEAEQLNAEIKVNTKQLAHLWHITKRVKNQKELKKYVLSRITSKTYLSVTFDNGAHQKRIDDRIRTAKKGKYRRAQESNFFSSSERYL